MEIRFEIFKNYKPFEYRTNRLLWKDKFSTPRCELIPQLTFTVFWIGVYMSYGSHDEWERWLWIKIYNNGKYEDAKETWGWIDCETKESTWKDFKYRDNFIIRYLAWLT